VPDIVAHLCPGEDYSDVMRRYDGDLVAIATDAMVARPLADWCGARSAAGARVYRYRFDHPGGGPSLRATHTAEVPLVFGTYRDRDAGQRLGGHATGAGPVAAALVAAWRSFLHGQGPGWPPLAEGRAPALGVFGGPLPHHVESGAQELTQA
jgi:carboxylesterase type B